MEFIFLSLVSIVTITAIYCISKWCSRYDDAPTLRKKNLLRKLSDSEEYFAICCEREIHIISYVFFVSSTERIANGQLISCMEHLMKLHPLLRASISKHNGHLYWKDNKNTKPIFRVDTSDNWYSRQQQISQAETFDSKLGPLWRLTFMPNVTSSFHEDNYQHQAALVFDFHHAIIDGQGVVKLLNAFQDLLSKKLSKNIEDESEPCQSLRLAPSWDAYIKRKFNAVCKVFNFIGLPITIWFSTPLSMYVQTRGAQHQYAFVHKNVSSQNHVKVKRNGMCTFAFTKEETSFIIAQCKQNHVTVQNAIQASGCIALTEIIQEAGTDKDMNFDRMSDLGGMFVFTAASSANIRYMESEVYSYIVCNNYGIMDWVKIAEFLSSDTNNLWSQAKRNKSFFKRRLGFLEQIFYFIITTSKHAILTVKDRLPNSRMCLIGFSNIGNCNRLNRHHPTPLKITGCFESFGVHVYGALLNTNVITLNERMFWGVQYAEHVTPRDVAQRYARRTAALLLQACREGLHTMET